MRTDIDVIDLLYKLLKPISANLSGGIYKFQRPADSNKEDIVINSLPLASGDIQNGNFNVNIHVPDLNLNINKKNQKQPNTKRLNELSKLVSERVDEVYNEDYNIWIEWEYTLKDIEIADNHYKNFRIKFISYKSYYNN